MVFLLIWFNSNGKLRIGVWRGLTVNDLINVALSRMV